MSALFLKDPGSARYAAGGLAEAEELFGSPLPDLPAPELDEGREVFLVHVHSKLRVLQQRFLEGQLGQIGALTLRTGDPARDFQEYEQGLARVVSSVRDTDRRQGLLNLFWLAHSLDAAEHLRMLEQRSQSLSDHSCEARMITVVPRTPTIAAGVSRRTASGASLAILPETYAATPRTTFRTTPSRPSAGA